MDSLGMANDGWAQARHNIHRTWVSETWLTASNVRHLFGTKPKYIYIYIYIYYVLVELNDYLHLQLVKSNWWSVINAAL